MTCSSRPTWAFIGALVVAVAAFGGCGESQSENLGARSEDAVIGCSQHVECEDGNPCTQNLCAVGLCAPPLPILGCCFNNDCFGDGGSGGGFGNGSAGGEASVPIGCSTDEQCEDGHPCSQNLCVVGLCTALPVLGCCFNGECTGGDGGAGTGVGIGVTGVGLGGAGTGSGGAGTDAGGADGTGANNGAGATSQAGAATSVGGDASDTNAAGGNGDSDTGGCGASSCGEGSNAGRNQAGQANQGVPHTDWVMEGGSCSVSTPSRHSTASLLLLAIGLGMAAARRRRRLAVLALAAPLALTASARAAGFAQDGYTAPAAPEDLMWSERAASDTGHLLPFGRLTLGYTDDPLVLVDANDSSREFRVVDDQFAMYGAFGFGFFRRAHLALLMPVYLQSSSAPQGASAVEGTRAGDLGVDGRFTLLNRQAPLELALAATLRLPTGDQPSFASDGRVTFYPRLLASKQLSDAGTLLNLSLGPVLRPSSNEPGVRLGSQLRLTVGGLVALSKVVGVTAEAATSTTADDVFSKSGTPVEAALGGRLSFSSAVLGTSLSTGLTRGVGAPDLRWLVMLALPGSTEPAPAPERVVVPQDDDADRDGAHGSADACPDEAEDRDGFDDADGCPELDNDKDGISDATDKCPAEAEDVDGFEDTDGCPEADDDKDGISDADDKCPSEAEDMDSWQDQDGCPEADNDNDSILDPQDKCPNEAETKNGVDDEDGCPDLVRIEEGQIRTLEPIFFDFNKATIQARSEPLLNEMANLIRTRPDLGVIAIEGYTDARGSAKYNLKLSRDRAAAVRNVLIKSGVAEARLTSDGFGSARPVEDNKTDAGRAKNRRVEFHFGDLGQAH
jgi:large repetitive protein